MAAADLLLTDWGLREHLEGKEDLAFVFDYEAAHKLAAQDLRGALAKENLFLEAVQRANSNKTETDAELRDRRRRYRCASCYGSDARVLTTWSNAELHMANATAGKGYGLPFILNTTICGPCINTSVCRTKERTTKTTHAEPGAVRVQSDAASIRVLA